MNVTPDYGTTGGLRAWRTWEAWEAPRHDDGPTEEGSINLRLALPVWPALALDSSSSSGSGSRFLLQFRFLFWKKGLGEMAPCRITFHAW